jgi:hypothetical protein
VLLLIIIGTFVARGHEAPSGWLYPQDCCASNDCRPISCTTVKENSDGSAEWLGLFFPEDKVRKSGDFNCHVCVAYSSAGGGAQVSRNGHCLFISPNM